MYMDPKVTKLMSMANAKSIQSFANKQTYNAVKRLTQSYANTTMEDYLWRLLRVLRSTTGFPKLTIVLYNALWLSVGGRPK
jgi:hypothetical protein